MTNKQNKKKIITAFNNCNFIVQVYVLLFEPFYGRYQTIQNYLQLGIDVKQFLENLKLINMILKSTKYPTNRSNGMNIKNLKQIIDYSIDTLFKTLFRKFRITFKNPFFYNIQQLGES